MIFLITYAKGHFPPREAQPMIYWGYYSTEEEAQARVDELNREGYLTWRSNLIARHKRAQEDTLYPELLENDENNFILNIFREASAQEPDLSEEAYRESGQASFYSVVPVASATDSPFTVPSI